MNLTTIIPVTILFAIIGTLYFIVSKIRSTNSSSPNHHEEDEENIISSELITLNFLEYKNLKLTNIFYSIVNEYNFDLNSVHSIDNAICLEFENQKWISVLFNSSLELFQFSDDNPNTIELNYALEKMNHHKQWQTYVGEKLIELRVNFGGEPGMLIPEDLILMFDNDQLTISVTEELTEEPEKISFGTNWLLVQFSKETYFRLREMS